jgi:threonyl-tRNA synthetase
MSNKVKLTLPDGTHKEYHVGITGKEVAESIGKRLAQDAVAVKINDEIKDVATPINHNAHFSVITMKNKEGLDCLRHSLAHLLAAAVMQLYPHTKRTIGPAIDNGFYFDFEFEHSISEADLPRIEEKMREILPTWDGFERHELDAHAAKKEYPNNEYKHELIDEFTKDGQKVSFYKSGTYWDLCRGGHLSSMKNVKPDTFKLTKLAGAYWRGSEKNKMLTRIYAVAFPTKKELDEYLHQQEEAAKRDHRKLGKELDWFHMHEYSPGSPFFHPKGAVIYNELLKFLREEYFKRGCVEVITPLLYDKALWETSGHWEHYQEDMFILDVDGRKFGMKPMNCPSHCLIYQNSLKSYRELPLRIVDFAPLHRNELKGVLGGLTRVRKFSQDDGHIFCELSQVESEIEGLFDFIKYIYDDVFKMQYRMGLGTRPEKSLGTDEMWKKAEAALESALKKKGIEYVVKKGDGAFYGPKIDFMVKDSLGREWQLATIQVDFNLPERFGLEYEGSDGKRHRPVMIHRALLGSLERFIGVLVEHTGGKMPLWLNPLQVKILPISDKHVDYAWQVAKKMKSRGIRVEVDERSESVNKKVREAQLEQANYILVVGDREYEDNAVSVRTRNNEVVGSVGTDNFIEQVLREIKEKTIK